MLTKRKHRTVGRHVRTCMSCKRRIKSGGKKIGTGYRCYWCQRRIAGI